MAATQAPKAARDRTAWCYVSGLVCALEGRLLSQRATAELLSSSSLEELIGHIRQTLLGGGLAEAAEPLALAESLQAAFAAYARQIGQASPAPAVADLFLLPIEWDAFRGFLRAKALGQGRTPAPGSAVPDAVWEQCWASADVDPCFGAFADAAAALRRNLSPEQPDPQLLDDIAHVHEARGLLLAARDTGSKPVAEWVAAWLRQQLALALLRSQRNEWSRARYADALADLGVTTEDIAWFLASERRDWRTPLVRLGLPAVQSIPDDDPLPAVAAERLLDDSMTDLSHAGRGIPFGPEIVFSFLWGLRVEAVNLKLLLSGIAAGLPASAIARDLRRTYV